MKDIFWGKLLPYKNNFNWQSFNFIFAMFNETLNEINNNNKFNNKLYI